MCVWGGVGWGGGLSLGSEGSPDLVGRPGAHPVLLGPAGMRVAVGG